MTNILTATPTVSVVPATSLVPGAVVSIASPSWRASAAASPANASGASPVAAAAASSASSASAMATESGACSVADANSTVHAGGIAGVTADPVAAPAAKHVSYDQIALHGAATSGRPVGTRPWREPPV